MRGLKALNHDAPDKNAKVASYADAWIKVKHSLTVYPQTHVASPAERMDERASQKSVLCVVKVLQSVRDAWIKRRRSLTINSELKSSYPSWMCGLKEDVDSA